MLYEFWEVFEEKVTVESFSFKIENFSDLLPFFLFDESFFEFLRKIWWKNFKA